MLKVVQRDVGHGVSAQAAAAPSYWGSGAKKLKIKPSNTNQKVIDILDDGIKTYAYKFTLSGDAARFTAASGNIQPGPIEPAHGLKPQMMHLHPS